MLKRDADIVLAVRELLSIIEHDDENAPFNLDQIKVEWYASDAYWMVSAHDVNHKYYEVAMYVYADQIIADGYN